MSKFGNALVTVKTKLSAVWHLAENTQNKEPGRFRRHINIVVTSIRLGLVSLISVLIIGALSLVLRSLPIDAYQSFINGFAGGFLFDLFNGVYTATFGLLSLYITCTISYHYTAQKMLNGTNVSRLACSLVSVASFVLFTGIDNLSIDTLGPKGMFLAIVTSLCVSSLFCFIFSRTKPSALMTDGADVHFNDSWRLLLPISVTVGLSAIISLTIFTLSGGKNAHELFHNAATELFKLTGNGLLTGFLYVFLSSCLWFVGIHGGDMLEGVSDSIFAPAAEQNIALASAGLAPTEILTKPFFDVFVLMGGCGSTICLLICLVLFGKRNSTRRVAHLSALPAIFNINESMVFGLPIIYNLSFLIPFILTPVICFFTSYAAMSLGIVPLVTSAVEWTTPVFIGGYIATGSVAGILLQLFNIILGVCMYFPFVRRYEKKQAQNATIRYRELVERQKEAEATREPVVLTQLPGTAGSFAKALAGDLKQAIDSGKGLNLYYQPQYSIVDKCIGAEALLRWNHKQLGMIYPPLIIQLAKELGLLQKLEQHIIRRSISDSKVLWDKTGDPLKISVNVTGESMQDEAFIEFLLNEAKSISGSNQIFLELTEQDALAVDDNLFDKLYSLKAAGYGLAIDDFSMGSTSLHYLQKNCFNLIKLDGGLVTESLENPRSMEIISSIVALSKTLGFTVLAEYVSSEKLRDNLAVVGCYLYQGWLYSPAITLDDFIVRLQSSETQVKK